MSETEDIMMELMERVTRIETRFEEHHKDILAKFEQAVVLGASHAEKIRKMEDSLTRYQGFWGAVTLIGAAITTFLTIFWDSVRGRVFGG
jgi:anaerobic ribonucleoside-triphosphate reductase